MTRTAPPQKTENHCQYYVYVAVGALIFVISSIFVVHFQGLSPLDFGRYLMHASDDTHHNIIFYRKLPQISLNELIYLGWFLGAAVIFAGSRLLAGVSSTKTRSLSIYRSLGLSLLGIFLVILTGQLSGLSKKWSYYLDNYTVKSEAERLKLTSIRQSLEMAEFCKQLLPGPHKADFVTDMDMDHGPNMLLHRSLAFHLYPIDIRDVRQQRSDSWIAFNKANARAHIPEGFELLGALNDENVIAVRMKP